MWGAVMAGEVEDQQGTTEVVTTAQQWGEALDDCYMTYAHPYANQLLKKHPLGKGLWIIRELVFEPQNISRCDIDLEKVPHPWDRPKWIMHLNKSGQTFKTSSHH